ncbi:MAG TPA: cobalt ECF transporter T component CbiQ [Actinomycetota bacterium]|nr:cobalt ECF transporter T component CbiQ [Actinomycetota bacterium]
MSGAHAHALYYHGHSRLHALPAECKIAAQLLFVFVVVATPREAIWAFGAYAAIVAFLAAASDLPFGFVVRRLAIEVPFVAFAVLLPFLAAGERIDVLGVAVSREGVWGAWNILAKATLGVAASVIVASTTTMPELLQGLERLRVPRVITSIASFMIRYLDVIADEMRRMRVARLSRGHDPRWLWQARAVAASAGALFIRSYERGERVYLAMTARGYDGRMPDVTGAAASTDAWIVALAVPAVALLVCVVAWGTVA